MKKTIMTYILMGALLLPATQINAIEKQPESIQLAQDVFIEGLTDSTVLQVGETISIKGQVDEQATQKEITWQVTGNNGIVDFNASGNEAKITAKAPGKLWVMARATDGSDRAREYTIHVKPATTEVQLEAVQPPISEAVPKLPNEENEKPPVQEVDKLPVEGNQKLPVQEVDKMLVEGNQKPSVEEVPKLSGKEDNLIISGGTGTSIEDPIIVTLNENLTSEEKIALISRYIKEFRENGEIRWMRKREAVDFTGYILQVSEQLTSGDSVKEESKNDFFIEIRVEKEDQEAYIPIIEMLDDLEKEVLQGIEHTQIVAQNQEKMMQNQEEVAQNQEEVAQNQESVAQHQEQGISLDEEQGQESKKRGFKWRSILVFLSLGAAFIIKNSL